MQIVRQSTFTALPWKNGGGVTHEAFRVPAEGAHFRWRVSMADVPVSGPFSDFSGYDRTLVLLRGRGVRLAFAGGREVFLREAGDLVEFDGGVATDCELLDGPCVDLNLMVARAAGPAQVWVDAVGSGVSLTPGSEVMQLVFPIGAAVTVAPDGGVPFVLEASDLLVMDGGEQARVTAVDGGLAPAPKVFLAMLRRS